MTIKTILQFPDPRLRQKAKPVECVDDEIRELVADMLETMYAAEGIGLAASQINIHKAIVVLDLSEELDQPQVFINPKITVLDEDECSTYQEGCLSVPGFYEEITRPCNVRVTALNELGEELDFEPDGLLAVCLQHEVDHLNGRLFVDYLSQLKRLRISKALRKHSA